MSKRQRNSDRSDNGFSEWGGYMDAKKAKLTAQFAKDAISAVNYADGENRIFNEVAIFVNGYTVPSADELKLLMIKYGGIYHHYYDSKKTTHVIASNLPNCKFKQLKTIKVVKPEWIVDSISAKKLLDYKNYLLFTDLSNTQPRLLFRNKISYEDCGSVDNNPNLFKPCGNEDVNLNVKLFEEKNFLKVDLNVEKNVNFNTTEDSCIKYSSVNENSKEEVIGYEEKKFVPENLVENFPNNSENFSRHLINNKLNNPKSNGYNKNYSVIQGSKSRMTASDENFLSEFYNNSRLHHISTMGATFKQYITQLRSKSNREFPGRRAIKNWLNAKKDTYLPSENGDSGDEEILCDNMETVGLKTKVIMHIDMDCFFVSVGLRNRPDLKGQPVAVTHAKAKGHSDIHLRKEADFKAEMSLYKDRIRSKLKLKTSTSETDESDPGSYINDPSVSNFNWVSMINETDSMSEIASCSYEARKAGVRNGMFLGQALKLCPDLKTIHYDFDSYKDVSYTLYNTVAEYTLDIEAVSCDEMFVDCTKLLEEVSCTPMEFGSFLRKQLKDKTGCPCSAGFGGNRLQARLATKKAKPDGQYFLMPQNLMNFMKDVNVADLPGVGKALSFKLKNMGVRTCLDLQCYNLSELQSEFGIKSGLALYNHCRGNDDRDLSFGHVRKSVSADVNYGIRFQDQNEAEKFLHQLSCEVRNRLLDIHMKAKCITLKLMVKAKQAPQQTAKFLGHGVCYNLSKSSSFTVAISDITVISREVVSLYRKLQVLPTDLRGIGIQLTHLVPDSYDKTKNAVLDKFLKPKDHLNNVYENKELKNEGLKELNFSSKTKVTSSSKVNKYFMKKPHSHDSAKKNSTKICKSSHLDEAVLSELPEDIRLEIINNSELINQNVLNFNNLSNSQDKILEIYKSESTIKKNLCKNLSRESMSDVFYNRTSQFRNNKDISSQENQNVSKPVAFYTLDDVNEKSQRRMNVNYLEHSSKMINSETSGKTELNNSFIEDDQVLLNQVRDMVRSWVNEELLPQLSDIKMIFSLIAKFIYKHRLSDLRIVLNTLFRSVKKKRYHDPWKEAYTTIIKLVQKAMTLEYGGELKLEHSMDV
ncbi:rev1 DNA directed polymerase [Lycorma delicatula]|uniref:rev1 DNA directed polymerase n=1 Tax=Lycorma delicatula TaxID=130591 RepID=UPI003F514681